MTTVVTAMEEFGPILDVDVPGIIEQNVGERDSAIKTMQSVTSEEGQSTTDATSEKTTTDVSFLYGEEEEEKRPDAVVKGGEVRTTNVVAMEPTTANGTATHTAATIDPAVTTAKTAWMLGSAIGEIEIPARSKRSMDQHSMLIFFSMLLVMAGIGLALCILSCGVGLARGALHIRISERDEV